MGNKESKSRLNDHVALPSSSAPVPNIVITRPPHLEGLESPKPTAPPPTPMDGSCFGADHQLSIEPAVTPFTNSCYEYDERETMVLAGTPPPDRPPPPPPDEAFHNCSGSYFGESTIIQSEESNHQPPPPLPPTPAPRTGFPVIKRYIAYSKDRLAQFDALNTTERADDYKMRTQRFNTASGDEKAKSYFSLSNYTPLTESSTTATTKSNFDEYPIYNPITDYSYQSGMSFQLGVYPIDTTRTNIGFCGRQGAGKSTLINALRGLTIADPQAAGRHACNHMEPFRFMEEELQNIVLWEVPYPRAFATVGDIYDRNMGFDRMYESHKLNLFRHLFVLVADGAPHDDDISFARIISSRRTPLTMLSTKSDDDLDAESRELACSIDSSLKRDYETRARNVFTKSLMMKAQILTSTELLFISSPVVKNLVSGTIGYLHYKLDEDRLLDLVGIHPGCHYDLENKLRKNRGAETIRTPGLVDVKDLPSLGEHKHEPTSMGFPPRHIQKSTVLADAGFEILFGTDDRVFGNLEPKATVRRAGRTALNYGFIGGAGVGKSAMINAMRGMSSKHPLAAGKSRAKRGQCERFEFDDDLLKYGVTLWELHYPKKISAYFEFIDRHSVASFTALFVLIEGTPSDEDLSFSKIAHRRNASVVFLSSKSDRKLAARSRSDEIPVCDLLKQRFVDKGLSQFDRTLTVNAPELCGRVHVFFVSAPVFRALRIGDARGMQYILHERAVFDFLKQKRIVADLLDSPEEYKEGLHANVNIDTAGVTIGNS
ncbi:hypothetical protein Aduo_018670 [Ancylostoma duodenale]